MSKYLSKILAIMVLVVTAGSTFAATTQKHYYAYDAEEDSNGVIAPWYKGLNGQCDLRARIAAETLKRYPWTPPGKAPAQYPEYLWSGHWSISPSGEISAPPFNDWDNGDMGQRAGYVLSSLADYYRYTGDSAAIAHMTWQIDFLLDYCLTDEKHPWPGILISVPYKGVPYGKADPKGMIQLDIVAEVGIGILKAYEITGNKRWLDAVTHWADLLAEHRDPNIGLPPWPRYANPECAPWPSYGVTGGVAYITYLFDDLIHLGYNGQNNSYIASRDAGRAYLRDKLLPKWLENDTWGYNYWDVPANWQQLTSTEFACRYMMDNKEFFPNWRNDVRNILAVFLNRTSAHPAQRGEVYSGAWAYPESFGCCGRSLWYTPMAMAMVYAQYADEASSEWGRELARRQQILSGYDIHETGVSEDNIDGGQIVNGAWFKIAHPMALKYMLGTIAWMPEELGANRENHIVRSSSVVNSVAYADGKVAYTTFDALSNTVDVLRLAFNPSSVKAEGVSLSLRTDLLANGYTVKLLSNGDCIVSVRHDGAKSIEVAGDDPQQSVDDPALTYEGAWQTSAGESDFGGGLHTASSEGASVTYTFTGNQVRLIGAFGPDGGKADVYVDGQKQLVGIDCWNPLVRHQQLLYYKNGLADGQHTLKVSVTGTANPYSKGTSVYVDSVQWSDASGKVSFGDGGGPTGFQRWILGYPGREDYIDSNGNRWQTGSEVAIHDRFCFDSAADTWWKTPSSTAITGTPDQELYKYGMHSGDYSANFTVGPGKYHARLKFAATKMLDPRTNCVTVLINGKQVVDKMDIVATAGGLNKAIDLVFNGIEPKNGIIDIRFIGGDPKNGIEGEAFVQAIEVGPGDDVKGADPVSINENLLSDPGFENLSIPVVSDHSTHPGWNYQFSGNGRFMPESSMNIAHGPEGIDIGSGKESLRIDSLNTFSGRAYQEVLVNPGAEYRASVWIEAQGLRKADRFDIGDDSAGLLITELDAKGNPVEQHPVAVSSDIPYTYLEKRFVTKPETVKVRFALSAGFFRAGSVLFDNCVLDGPRVPCSVTGRVTSEGKGLKGAVITAGRQSAITASDGSYRLNGLSVSPTPISIRASRDGFYAQRISRTLEKPDESCDFDLVATGANLLKNAGFDDGWAGDWVTESEESGAVDPVSDKSMKSGMYAARIALQRQGAGGGRIYQQVVVQPDKDYTASVQVYTPGEGWGTNAEQKGGLFVQEYDRLNKLIAQHQTPNFSKFHSFNKVELKLHTSRRTMFVRVGGCARLPDGSTASVLFDSFELNGPAGPVMPPLSGAVKSGDKYIGGASIKSADGKIDIVTSEDGYYSLKLPDGPVSLTISKEGYYTQRRNVNVKAPTVFTFDLVPVDGNLLINAGFDDGWPNGWEIEASAGALVRAGHTPSQFSPLYPLFYHSGEESTEILSGNSKGESGRIWQRVAVKPNQTYKASAWFRAYGPGWGKKPEQKAGLFVQELDKDGTLIQELPIVWADRYDDWIPLSLSFTTGPQTAFVKVGGYAFMMDDYNTTTYRAVFDTFALNGPAASK